MKTPLSLYLSGGQVVNCFIEDDPEPFVQHVMTTAGTTKITLPDGQRFWFRKEDIIAIEAGETIAENILEKPETSHGSLW